MYAPLKQRVLEEKEIMIFFGLWCHHYSPNCKILLAKPKLGPNYKVDATASDTFLGHD